MKDLKDYGEASASAAIEMDFILKNGETYILGSKKIEEYIDSYPKVDVISALKSSRQWLIDNPKRRKTSRGMGKFFNNWLCNSLNKQSTTKSNGFASIDF